MHVALLSSYYVNCQHSASFGLSKEPCHWRLWQSRGLNQGMHIDHSILLSLGLVSRKDMSNRKTPHLQDVLSLCICLSAHAQWSGPWVRGRHFCAGALHNPSLAKRSYRTSSYGLSLYSSECVPRLPPTFHLESSIYPSRPSSCSSSLPAHFPHHCHQSLSQPHPPEETLYSPSRLPQQVANPQITPL